MKTVRLQDKHLQTVVINTHPRTMSVTSVCLRNGVMVGRAATGHKVSKPFSATGHWEQLS